MSGSAKLHDIWKDGQPKKKRRLDIANSSIAPVKWSARHWREMEDQKRGYPWEGKVRVMDMTRSAPEKGQRYRERLCAQGTGVQPMLNYSCLQKSWPRRGSGNQHVKIV